MSSVAVYPSQLETHHINLTDSARAKMKEILADADDDLTGIRVFVSGGGCGGMQYGFTFAEGANEIDSILEGDGFNLYLDPVAFGYLEGCEIDFTKTLTGETFVFNNVFQAVGGSGACGACGAAGGGCGG